MFLLSNVLLSISVCVVPFVILAYLENGRLEKTACLHQIFLKLVKDATESFEMLKVAFGEQIMGRTQIFKWFYKFKSNVTSMRMPNDWYVHRKAKQMKMWIK
jgi:hypothetical protein